MDWYPVLHIGVMIAVFFIVASYALPVLSRYRRYTNNIVNHDPNWREFCYRTTLRRQAIFQRLSIRNGIEDPGYFFDPQSQVIHFYEPPRTDGSSYQYLLIITELPAETHLRVRMLSPMFRIKSVIPLQQNEFWCKKLDATPVEYSADTPMS